MDEANFENIASANEQFISKDKTDKLPLGEAIKFWGFYHAADALWVGGALAGDAVAEHGVNRWVSAAGTAIAVTGAEYGLSNIAVESFERPEDIDKEMGLVRKVGSEALASLYVAVCGSFNAVKINDSLGIESSPKRRLAQAALFGSAVSLWVTSIPGFEDGREIAKDYLSDMVDSTKNFLLYSAVSVGAILGASKIIKEVRKFFTRNKKSYAQDHM